jgi:hypothetical protein
MYNFVIFSTPSDYYDAAYHGLTNMSNVDYIRDVFQTDNRVLKLCYKINYYFQGKKFPKNPVKSFFNRFLFESRFDNDAPICFVFTERVLFLYNYGFIDTLRATHPTAKFVCFLQDLGSTVKNVELDSIFSEFDLSVSYDRVDAEKFNILYHPTPYSLYSFNQTNTLKSSDVYFVGRAKDRLDDIIKVYEKLTEMGLSCDFHITDVELKDQKYSEDIKYNCRLSYEENLEHVNKAKYLLEIVQKEASGYSLRTWEAIFYDKFLITNNLHIKSAPFFNERYILMYESAKDLGDLMKEKANINVNFNYMDKLHPQNLLKFIETHLRTSNLISTYND